MNRRGRIQVKLCVARTWGKEGKGVTSLSSANASLLLAPAPDSVDFWILGGPSARLLGKEKGLAGVLDCIGVAWSGLHAFRDLPTSVVATRGQRECSGPPGRLHTAVQRQQLTSCHLPSPAAPTSLPWDLSLLAPPQRAGLPPCRFPPSRFEVRSPRAYFTFG